MPTIKHNQSVPEVVEPVLPEAPKGARLKEETFLLPDGRKVHMARPPIPTQLILPTLMASCEPNAMSVFSFESFVRALLHVRSIDDRPMPTVTEYTHINQIAMQLGEEGIEAAQLKFQKIFPPMTEAQLEAVKK